MPWGWREWIGAGGSYTHFRPRLYPSDRAGSYRFKAIVSVPASPAPPRPANASPPSVNFTSIAGTYNNSGYGNFELCLISHHNTAASRSCQALISNASVILPGIVDSSSTGRIPTFLAEWNTPWASHIRLTHWNGNTFNISGLSSFVSSYYPVSEFLALT